MATRWRGAVLGAGLLAASGGLPAYADGGGDLGGRGIKQVLLISIDGMHAVDFSNCASGLAGVNSGSPYCPNLAELGESGTTYTQTSTSKPSDSFPGLTALVTGGSPRSTGAFYDVSYDRSLSPPYTTTPYGIVGGPGLCPGTVGTQVGFDEQIDIDLTKLDAGGGINPQYLPRDPDNDCAPVYPHTFIRVNTMFEVVKAAGGYTAWSDKHQSYELVNGKSGKGVDDFYAPEINSIPVALPQVTLLPCSPLPDQTAVSASNAWTDSFANIECYDSLKVQAILNEIDGKDHTGTIRRPVPNVFGMNFQAVSVGQKLHEKSLSTPVTGGYADNIGTPSPALINEIMFVDGSIGKIVAELKKRGLYRSTLIIISAKHGQSPIDPNRVLRIPADNASDSPPSAILSPRGVGPGFPVVQALEDDVSLLWLADNSSSATTNAVATLEANAATIGADGGQIYSGPLLALLFNDPSIDPRTPNIIVAPDVGVIYTGGTKKIAEHGGFAHDDRNVIMLVSNPSMSAATVNSPVETYQIAPTILAVLGLDPDKLIAVQKEGTQVLPGLGLDTGKSHY
jgi:Type I phosphodiesterase / nucleotide pyrophosphatase